MPVSGRMRPGRAFFIPKIARHGVKLHSQGGCDPRKQSAGGKEEIGLEATARVASIKIIYESTGRSLCPVFDNFTFKKE